MEKWTKEKAEGKIPVDQVEELLNGNFLSSFPFPRLLRRFVLSNSYAIHVRPCHHIRRLPT